MGASGDGGRLAEAGGAVRAERRFSHEGTGYRYLVWGRDGHAGVSGAGETRPLVLVHGFAQRAESWDEVARLVVRASDAGAAPLVAALDLVGHGGSDRPSGAGPYGLAAQARTLVAFARSIGGGAPVSVCGYSMGGRIVLGALADAPDAFAAVTLESAGIGPRSGDERSRLAERNRAWAKRLRSAGVASFMEYWEGLPLFSSQRALPAEVRSRVRAERLGNDAEALARSLERAGAHAMPDERETTAMLAARVRSGVRVVYAAGSLDAKYAAVARRCGEATEGAVAVRIVEGCGHNAHLEDPGAFARLLASAR